MAVKKAKETVEEVKTQSPEVELLMAQNKALQEQLQKQQEQQEQFQKQMEMMAQLMSNQNTQVATIAPVQAQDDSIRFDKYIKVMSLCKGLLVLTTETAGGGKAFRFKKFGETKSIMYQDLILLVHNQQRFAEEGYFYIFDDAVVNSAGLKDFYDTILTKDVMENIVSYETKEAVELFENASPGQRETIVSLLIEKFMDAESVPYDKLDAISRVYGRNIYQLITEIKEAKEIDQPEKG